jgi:hypothetical protein
MRRGSPIVRDECGVLSEGACIVLRRSVRRGVAGMVLATLLMTAGCAAIGSGGSSAGSGSTTAPGASGSGVASGTAGSASAGATLVAQRCTRCHPIDRIQKARKTRAQWTATLSRMQSHGLQVTGEERASIIDYLALRDGSQ